MKNGGVAPSAVIPRRKGVCSDVRLSCTPEDGREGSGAVGPCLREAEHACGGVLQLELVDLVLHIGHAVSGDRVQNLLGLCGRVVVDRRGVQGRLVAVLRDVGVDLCGVDRAVVIGRVDGSEGVAAILLPYRLFILYFL